MVVDALPVEVAAVLDADGVEAGARVVVACSGGADSTALAHACMALVRDRRLGELTLVYVDHQLRPDSAADGDQVARLAAAGGAAMRVLTVEVDRGQASLEAAARQARYAALDAVAAELGAARVLLAHTASDQAETVVMRLIRGTGVVGLSAIPRRRGLYLRPLLGLSRADVEGYLGQHRVTYVNDPSNDDRTFLRNRIRHDLLPRLRAENPDIDAALCRVAAAASEQRETVDFAAGWLLAASATAEGGLDVDRLAAAPSQVIKRALALAVENAGGMPLEARHQRSLLELVQRAPAGTVSVDMPSLRVVREYNCLRLEAEADTGASPRLEVSGPGGPYSVRRWRAGDRMCPLRLRGRSRKLSDLFIDAKIPRERRPGALVVVRESDGTIEWVQHIGLAYDSPVEVTLTSSNSVARNKDNR